MPRSSRTALSLVPRSEELEHPVADRPTLEDTAVEKDGGRHEKFI